MRIAVGADHAGFSAKRELMGLLARLGHEAVDLGTDSEDSVDYPIFGKAVAEAVASGRAERGIAVCGSGIGMSIAANRIPRARAAVCHSVEAAALSRQHNDANVLCLGARLTPPPLLTRIVETWLSTPFEGGRHLRRVGQLGIFALLSAAAFAVGAPGDGPQDAAGEAYESFRAALAPGDAAGHLALARWCGERGLADRQRELLLHVLGLGGRPEEAYRGLGYVFQDGIWMSPEDARRERGLVFANGEWVPASAARASRVSSLIRELDARNADIARRAAEELLASAQPGDAPILTRRWDGASKQARPVLAGALWKAGAADFLMEQFLDLQEDAAWSTEIFSQEPRALFVEAAQKAVSEILKKKSKIPAERLARLAGLLESCPGARSGEILYRLAIEPPSSVVRQAASQALARRRDAEVFEAVCQLLARGTGLGRERAAALADALGNPRAVPFLVDSLEKTLRMRARAEREAESETLGGGFLIGSTTGTGFGRAPFGCNAFLGFAGAFENGPELKRIAPELGVLQRLTGKTFGEDPAEWRRWWAESSR